MHTGGHLATGVTMLVTYLAGWLAALSGRISEVWTHVTPGQAALVIGLLTYATHNGPKLVRFIARRRPRRRGRAGKGGGP